MRVQFSWQQALVALGFMIAAGYGAGYSGLPDAARAACGLLVAGIAAAAPSFLLHRGDPS